MNKKFVHYLIIFLAGLLLSYFAKMEAINLLLAVPVGVIVTVYAFKVQKKAREWVNDTVEPTFSWHVEVAGEIILAITRLHYISMTIPILIGIASSYLVYSSLNALFISP